MKIRNEVLVHRIYDNMMKKTLTEIIEGPRMAEVSIFTNAISGKEIIIGLSSSMSKVEKESDRVYKALKDFNKSVDVYLDTLSINSIANSEEITHVKRLMYYLHSINSIASVSRFEK